MKTKPNKNQNFSSSTRHNLSMEAFFFTMNNMISNPNILHQSSQNPLSLSSCFFALGIVAILFLVGQAKFPTLGRILVWIGNFAPCAGSLFVIAFMHHIFGNILSWLPNRRRNNHAIEGGSDMSSHHHHDQETLGQASPAPDIVTLFHMVLMEVLDRVWEDLVMEDGPSPALQLQVLEALPLPLQYCKGGREITLSCCSDRCTICLEDFMDGEFCRVFTCKHMFHSDCIIRWLKSHLTCPICRNSVVDT